MKNILITGGARSGKSYFAQELAMRPGKRVLFVATAVAGDEEMQQRIEEHKQARPAEWSTLEVSTRVGSALRQKSGQAEIIIVDCITLLVNNIFSQHSDPTGEIIDAPLVEKAVISEISELVECIKDSSASFIIVTNELGSGLVPVNKMSRLYRDLLGKANQLLAQTADEVYLMVAGLPLVIKPSQDSGR